MQKSESGHFLQYIEINNTDCKAPFFSSKLSTGYAAKAHQKRKELLKTYN